VLFTKNRHIIIVILLIIHVCKFFHFAPLEDHSTFYCASHMSCYLTIFVITLNAAAFLSVQAVVACNIESFQIQDTFNFVLVLIYKVDFRCPVDTDQVCIDILLLINAFHCTFQFSTKEALNISAS